MLTINQQVLFKKYHQILINLQNLISKNLEHSIQLKSKPESSEEYWDLVDNFLEHLDTVSEKLNSENILLLKQV